MLKQLKYFSKVDWFLTLVTCLFVISNVYCELKIPEYMQEIVFVIKSGGTTKDILINGAHMLYCPYSRRKLPA